MTDQGALLHRGVGDESSRSAVSWAAIVAGAVVASALTISLLALGSGLGLVSTSPWTNTGVSAATLGTLAIAWLAAVQLFASGVGGYIAGRLRTNWVDVHTDEVFFRDTAHGFLVWALGTIITAVLLTSLLVSATSGAARIAGTAVQATGSAVSSAASAAAGNSDVTGYFNDMLFRTQAPPAATGDQAGSHAEVARIMARSALNGELSADDKAYVSQVVARETGLSPEEADKRVTDVVAQAKATAADAAAKAKQAADTARKVAAYTALWVFASLLIGAFSATYLATVGGRLRDDLPAMG